MVAIVTGSGLGLEKSSAKVFAAAGQQGGQLGDAAFGRYGETVFVNASTGNLMIDRTDEVLIGRGPDDIISRSYNSLGANQGYLTQHRWQLNDQRAIVGLTGTLNAQGSTVTRIGADGSDTVYSYDQGSNCYICKQQAGNTEYRLTYNTLTSSWMWSDAKNNLTEFYDDAHGGRLSSTYDSSGNTLTYTYDSTSGLLTKVTTADGEYTELTWSGTNLSSITVKSAGGTFIESRVSYTYTTNGRLKTVTTDLSNKDGTVGSDAVVTTYAYEGSSDRISKITQTGGAEVDFTYDTSNRIKTFTQVAATGQSRLTTFNYGSGYTDVVNQDGQTTRLYFDSSNQLTQVTYPAAYTGATAENYYYAYNNRGDLTSATDALGNVVNYSYDTSDNLTQAQDQLGNTVNYTYDTSNHMVTKTYLPGSGQSGSAATTRYAYNSAGLLRFAVSAEGEVTEYNYNSYGQRTNEIDYTDYTYDVSALGQTDTITETQLAGWVSNLKSLSEMATVQRIDYTYDFRGNLATETTYTACRANNGNGITNMATKPYKVVTYTYDQAGNLLTRQTSGMSNTEVFTYDGLDRMTSSLDLNGTASTIAWNDGADTCTVSVSATTLVTVSTYDYAGELVTLSKSGTNLSTETSSFKYDDMGRLCISTDATGVTSYFLYDNLGRKTADISDTGSITEYRYDSGNRLVATIGYFNKLNATKLGQLVDTGGNPTDVAVASILPTASANDVWNWRVYDADGRLTETIDGDGDVTTYAYDNRSNVILSFAYANKLSSTVVSGFQTTFPTSNVTPTTSLGQDDRTRSFFDPENRLIGQLNGDGDLSRIIYDHAGRKIETVTYSTKVNNTHFNDSWANLLTDVGTTSSDIHTRYFYDDQGLMLFSLDAKLVPTQYVYDSAGHLTSTIAYSAPITATGTYTLAYLQSQTASLGGSNNQKSWLVRDPTNGSVAYSIDSGGEVTSFLYDAMGKVVSQTQYATTYSPTSLPSKTDMDTWIGTNASSNDRNTRYAYDPEERLVFTIDAEHYVTRNIYDAAGRVTLSVRYADTIASSGVRTYTQMLSWAGATIPSTAIQTGYSYDADGQLTDVIADLGGLAIDTHTKYDALGRKTDITVAWNTADAVTTHYTYDTANRMLTRVEAYQTGDAATTSYTSYDGLGNLLAVSDPLSNVTTYTYDELGNTLTATDGDGNVVTNTYDAFGNLATSKDPNNHTTTFAYDTRNQLVSKTDALSNVTSYTYDAFGNVQTMTDPLGGVVYSFYDKLNRQTAMIDQSRYVTLTTYTMGGAVASVTRLATPIADSVTITPGVLPTLTYDATNDATTTFTRDKLDRVTQTTDAVGFYEKYTLDAFGNRLQVYAKASGGTIALGGLTTNTFDHRGLLASETLPIVAYDSLGNPITGAVVNTYTYDLRGNRLTMVEADGLIGNDGLAKERTTTYGYDKLNRLKVTNGDQVSVVDDDDINHVHTITPATTNIYDKNGNLIETDDPSGARTLFYYDDANRRIAMINALGTYTTYTYDDVGNMTATRTYGDAVSLPITPGGNPPNPVDANDYRETTYTYDAINRLTFTTVANVLTGSFDGTNYGTTTGSVSTENRYNKSVNGLRQIDGLGNSVWTYYDRLGRKIAEVDQLGYLTTYTLDANGNATQERRYANAVSGLTIADTTTLDSIKSHVTADNTNDRITNFTYDRNGRRLTEQRLNVVAYVINAGSGAKSVDSRTTSTVTYTYNGMGEVLTKAEATGDTTTYFYDSAGRQTEVLMAAYTNVDNNPSDGVNPTTVQERINEKYDALGNLVFVNSLDDLQDPHVYHTTNYVYGAGGRLLSVTDATGFERDYQYDANGRAVIVSYSRLHSDGTTTLEAQVTQYDDLGRVVSQGTASNPSGTSWVMNDTQETAYTVFGETHSLSINGIEQKNYTYDNDGRLVKLVDEGVASFYLYDKAGNQTLMLTSDGDPLQSGALQNMDIGPVVTLAKNGTSYIGGIVQGIVETINVYDARGQATQTRLPNRELSGNATDGFTRATITTGHTYNAFGEVLTETDGNGYTTTFTYNTLGKITSQISPAVTVVDADGTVHSGATPTQYNFYDISGRLVGVQDPNGVAGSYLNTRTLVANTGYGGSDALVAEEFHADSGKFINIYDAANNLITQYNEIGVETDYTYDKMGRLTQVVHPLAHNGSYLADNYTYDGLGQRLTHWNSQFGSTHKETTDYDAEGRIAKTADFDGYVTTYAYEWHDAVDTHGITNVGGWTKTTTNTAGLTDELTQDAEGRAIGETDYGGNEISYSYDLAGRVATRINNYVPSWTDQGELWGHANGETLTYRYFNTGLTAETTSSYSHVYHVADDGNGEDVKVWDVNDTIYAYDKNGNELQEDEFYTGIENRWDPYGTTITLKKHELATYDALNRMLTMTDTGETLTGIVNGVDDPVSVTISYDANGNVRRRQSTYYLLNDDGSVATTQSSNDYWYTYDRMNRFLITKGTMSSGTIGYGSNGTQLTYDASGQRLTAVTEEFNTSTVETDTYHYADDGTLYQADITASGSTQTATYTMDTMGRVTTYKEINSSGTVVYQRDAHYDYDSLVTDDTVKTVRSDGSGTFTWATVYDYTADIDYDGDQEFLGGVVVGTTATESGSATAHTASNYSYIWFGSAVESSESYDSDTNSGSNPIYTSTLYYDQREFLTEADIHDGVTRDVSYEANSLGQVTRRDTEGVTNAPHARYYYFGGRQMGDVSNDGTSNYDYVTAIKQHTATPGSGFFVNGKTTGTHYADFDQSYDAINGLTYQGAQSNFIAKQGDTLQSIAQEVWGDSNFWYLIAQANGLDSTSEIEAGMQLIIPNRIANSHNTSDTYSVYDPNEHIGNISPTHPPKPQHHGNCGIFGQILMVIVAVVVTALIPGVGEFIDGAISTALGGVIGSTAAGIVGGFVGGAVTAAIGDAAGQVFGLAIGATNSFNWSELGMAAIGGGIAGPPQPGLGLVDTVIKGVIDNAVTQGIGVATGLQKSFNWAGVAAAGVSAGVIHEVSGQIGDAHIFGNETLNTAAIRGVSGMAGAIASAATRTLITGTDFGDNILKALPDVIGQTIGGAIADNISAPHQQVTLDDGTVIDYTPPNGQQKPLTTTVEPGENTLALLPDENGPPDGADDVGPQAESILGPAIRGDSDLGNWLAANVPLIGGTLGRIGDVANGLADIFTGSVDKGFHEIAGGVGGLAQIAVADALATAVGAVGKVWVTGEDLINLVTAGRYGFPDRSTNGGRETDPTGPLGALTRFLYDLPIPEYGLMSGPNWGTTQWGDRNAPFLNLADDTARVHDQHLDNKEWVTNQWDPSPPDIIPTGPVGLLNFLYGAGPFLGAYWYQDGNPHAHDANSSIDLEHYPK